MTQTFEYKPAMLTSKHKVTVSENGITLDKPGISDTARWSDIISVRYSAIRTHVGESQGLEFILLNGRRMSINRNDPDQRFEDADDLAYRKMFVAISEGLASHRPEIDLMLGEKKTVQWILFSMGLVCFLFAIALPILAFSGGRSSRMGEALIPIGAMILFGGSIMWNFHPFQPPTLIKPKLIIDKMKALD